MEESRAKVNRIWGGLVKSSMSSMFFMQAGNNLHYHCDVTLFAGNEHASSHLFELFLQCVGGGGNSM